MKRTIRPYPVLFSCIGAASLLAARLIPSGKDAPIWYPIAGLVLAVIGCLALLNAYRVSRQVRSDGVAAVFSDAPEDGQGDVPRGLSPLERILALGVLAALGAFGVIYSWVLWVAALGALAFTVFNVQLLLRRRKLSAVMAPFFALAFLGGCGIFILIGAFVGMAFAH